LEIDRGLTENDVPLFTGYNDVLLNYRQLKSIFDKQIADWKNRLDCCNCIYLIQDKNNGKQYVGSTYGKEGIWGCWREYAETGHGNDVQLMEKLEEDPFYAEKNFNGLFLKFYHYRFLMRSQLIENFCGKENFVHMTLDIIRISEIIIEQVKLAQ